MSDEEKNLQIMRDADNYNRWIYTNIARWVGTDVLEVGSGLGSMSKFFLKRNLTCVDINEEHLNLLRVKFREFAKYINEDLSKPLITLKREYDTVVCINVLEHVKFDRVMLRNFKRVLKKNGKLVLVVPAYRKLYGSIDKADNHYRRYDRSDILEKVEGAGFRVVKCSYMNMAGWFGWWWHGKFLKLDVHKQGDIGLFNKLVPLFARVESVLPKFFGLSLVVIAE